MCSVSGTEIHRNGLLGAPVAFSLVFAFYWWDGCFLFLFAELSEEDVESWIRKDCLEIFMD